MTTDWRERNSKHAPNSLDAPASTLTGFELAVHVELARRAEGYPRPTEPLAGYERRVQDAADAALRPSNVIPFPRPAVETSGNDAGGNDAA